MSRGLSFPFWTRLSALTFLTTGSLLGADQAFSPTPAGYKDVPVHVGNKVVPIRVKDAKDPFRNVSSANRSGKYNPENVFSTASSMADKTFTPSASVFQSHSDFKDPARNTFITKAYAGDTSTQIDTAKAFSTKPFSTSKAYLHSAAGFDKGFPTSAADAGLNKAAVMGSSTAFADQNRTAILGGSGTSEMLVSNSMAHKQYLGAGAQNVPDDVAIKDNIVLTRMSGVPDRALSIDEVRNLINHGTKPDTSVKPEAPSKPLNDPDYKPEPLRDNPSPGAANDDDKDDAVPPPGMMAAPENAEPLPQR